MLPPNPSLVAVLFVVTAKAGPRLVFHYPPHPRGDLPPVSGSLIGLHPQPGEPGTATDSEEAASDEDLPASIPGRGRSRHAGASQPSGSASGSVKGKSSRAQNPDDEDENALSDDSDQRKTKGYDWETLFGLRTQDLETSLVPSRQYHRKKFELSLEPLVYVGHPVFVREDGLWRKRKKSKKNKTGTAVEDLYEGDAESRAKRGKSHEETDRDVRPAAAGHVDKNITSTEDTSAFEDSADDDTEFGKAKLSDTSKEEKKTKASKPEGHSKAMSMFNVVFVLNPFPLEHNLRVNEMHDHVGTKLSMALRYEQARSGWVWKQAEQILSMKEKAKEDGQSMASLWAEILATSDLAMAIRETFMSISASKIAEVTLNKWFAVSLQIPQISMISRLPKVTDPHFPGVWLTTAGTYDEDSNDGTLHIPKHFSILLLDDVENILKDVDVAHGPAPMAEDLVMFLKAAKPTLSFNDIATASKTDMRTVAVLVSHLIFWRRGRAIPPLDHRDFYVPSPNIDYKRLQHASDDYARRFPTLPSLAKMLAALSGTPRPYRNFIPSKDHRAVYLEILAFLMRGGWVIQLRHFAWVNVSAEVKMRVKENMAMEDKERLNAHSTGEDSKQRKAKVTLPDSSTSSGSSQPSYSSKVPNGFNREHLGTSSLKVSQAPSPLESAWLEAIPKHHFPHAEDAELHAIWPRLTRYFNGRNAFETIAVREGLKRRDVFRWLSAFEAAGAITVVRHW